MFTHRMTVIVGSFGSGKTEIAINGALELARRGEDVTLVDLDVVKPYFRSRALTSTMSVRGVRIVAPDGEDPFADRPIVRPELRGLLVHGGPRIILDVGGDPVGALVFGAVSDAVPRDDIEQLVVLNFARPQTETVEQAVAMVRAIQAAARLQVDGLVANTHLLGDTTSEILLGGLRLTEQTASVLGLRVAFVAVEERLVGACPTGWAACPVLALRRMVFPPFAARGGQSGGAVRPCPASAARPEARNGPAPRRCGAIVLPRPSKGA